MWREMRGERKRERERESKKERIAMSLCERAKSLCCSGRLAPSPDAGSLPLLLMIMKLVCVNLLDLDNDILNIIGDYVRADNERRISKEDDFEKTDFIMNYLKENNKFNKYEIGEALYSQLFKNCCTEEEIKEYVETRKLKRYVKKYNLSKKR